MENKLSNALHWIIDILNKHNVPYQISGGFSAHLYGSKRPINDIDMDIPEEDFDKIYDEVKEYITFGPDIYKDERWDVKLMTLDYFGQEIDISGAYNQNIFNDETKEWVYSPANLSNSKKINFEDIELNVISPEDLIKYKKLLIGDHQKVDIKAVQDFIKK